jgi:amylosucrase
LAGLERAIEIGSEEEKELAIRRMLLLQGITLSIGGIPLLYLGEEWGMLNDYDFVKDPAKAGDTRWVHRPKMQWEFLVELETSHTPQNGSLRGRIFRALQKLIATRKRLPAFSGQNMELIVTKNDHVLGFVRSYEAYRTIVLANFAEQPQAISGNQLRTAGLGRFFDDAITGRNFGTSDDVLLAPFEFLWLCRV